MENDVAFNDVSNIAEEINCSLFENSTNENEANFEQDSKYHFILN